MKGANLRIKDLTPPSKSAKAQTSEDPRVITRYSLVGFENISGIWDNNHA